MKKYGIICIYDNGNELNDISHIQNLFTTREQAQRELDKWKEEEIAHFNNFSTKYGADNIYADENCLRHKTTDEIYEKFLIIELED